MFKQEAPNPFLNSTDKPVAAKKHRRTLYAAIAVTLALVLVVSAVLATQGGFTPKAPEATPNGDGSSLQLRFNYAVGEQMVYETTNVVTNPSAPNGESTNLTKTMDVIGETNDAYQVTEEVTVNPDVLGNLPTITVNISKAGCYNNFIPDVPSIFYNASANSALSAYVAKTNVNVGDVWTIPVNTGNSSLGMTGEVTLKFASIQDITVPAGTYKAMKIEVTSNALVFHSDGTSVLKISEGTTLQLNGTTFVEQGTCRLIKAELTQSGPNSSGGTSTLYSERTLVQHTRP